MKYTDTQIKEYIKQANEILDRAYVPYSKFHVGAVVVDTEGNVYKGINVENASYGLTICAERNAISSAITEGMKKIDLIVITGNTDEPISPCGMCRQVIREFATPDTRIVLATSKNDNYIVWTLEEMIPYSFGPEHL